MTHAELVTRAVWWLAESQRCEIVLAENGGGLTREMPDAIGWKGQSSVIVECKISVADLRADFQKPWRKYPDLGMGAYRWYLVPAELQDSARKLLDTWRGEDPDEPTLQDSYRWGLLVCHPSQIRVASQLKDWDRDWSAREGRISALGREYEHHLLIATLARIAFRVGTVTLGNFVRRSSEDMKRLLDICPGCNQKTPCACALQGYRARLAEQEKGNLCSAKN